MSVIKKALAVGFVAVGALTMTGCASDAKVASDNISTAADNFEINRRIVFLNVQTGKYELEIQGRCSIDDDGNQLEVTCKTAENSYKKHYLGKAQDFTYFAEQLEGADVSVYHYRVIFKPQSIIPAPELDVS